MSLPEHDFRARLREVQLPMLVLHATNSAVLLSPCQDSTCICEGSRGFSHHLSPRRTTHAKKNFQSPKLVGELTHNSNHQRSRGIR